MRRVFQAQFVCRRERRTQFVIKLPVFKESSYLYNNFVCWDCAPELYLEKTTCLSSPRFAWILSNRQKYFLNLWSIQIFFTFGIGPDILIKVLEDCIVFLIWAAWTLLNFHLKQKRRFSVWSFTENASFISVHGGIWSKYSEVNRFKTSKGLSFQK